MHVVFGIERHIEVEHGRHILDVQPARRHVGTHQQIDFAFFEGVERLQTFILALVAMQCGGFQAFPLQRTGQARAAQLAVYKHKGLLHAALLQNLMQRVAFVVVADAVETLLDGGRGGIGPGDFNRHRILQVTAGQAFDLGRERGREQQRDALLGQVAQNALQIGQKTDVQHAVGFVQHHVLNLVKHGILGLNVVQQATRCGHQNFNTFFQLDGLGLHVHAAEHHGTAQLGVFGIVLDGLRHLVGQFTRGQQHQGAHGMAGG